MTREVTFNADQDLYVIPDGNGCSCLGWDVMVDRMATMARIECDDLFGPLVFFSEKQPPNDYSYKCVIVFRDGYEALSDGGSVHDACVKSGIAHAWREVLPNIKTEGPAESGTSNSIKAHE